MINNSPTPVLLPSRYIKLRPEGEPNPQLEALVTEVLGDNSPAHNFKSLKGGITNQLIMFSDNKDKQYLVRAFGRGTDSFIDRDREFAVHQQLTTLGLAPQLVCRFGNGLIYEYLQGRPLDYKELSEPEVIVGVSNRLAQWHAQLLIPDVEKRIKSRSAGDLWTLLDQWIKIAPESALPLSAEELRAEFEWVKSILGPRGGPIVMGHCDLLSGNILCSESWVSDPSNKKVLDVTEPYQPSKMLTFIDYEYALPTARAFDIANHFVEWQGFECDKSRVPFPSVENETVVAWANHYLRAYSYYTGQPVGTVDGLIHEIATWWGMPGFYWGVWSAIQSATSEIDFDYASYAKERFAEYTEWKSKIWPTLSK